MKFYSEVMRGVVVLALALSWMWIGVARAQDIAAEYSVTDNAKLIAGPSHTVPAGVTDYSDAYDTSLSNRTIISRRDEDDDIGAPEMYCADTDNKCLITGCVPVTWYRGCAPTAASVLLSCHRQNFPLLFGEDVDVFDDSAVGAAMLNMISSQNNFDDYCYPMDSDGAVLNDKSALSYSPHDDDCLADLMHTSQSAFNNAYGETLLFDVPDAINKYLALVDAPYDATMAMVPFSDLTWESLLSQIQGGYPVMLVVDSNLDGNGDHVVVCVGYNKLNNKFAALNLFDHRVHWYPFHGASPHWYMGIHSAIFFHIGHKVPPFGSCRSKTYAQFCYMAGPRCQWCPMRLAPSYGQCVPNGLCNVMRSTCDFLRWPFLPPQFVCLQGAGPSEYLWCSRTWFEGLMPCAPGTACRIPGPHRYNPCW